MSCQAVGSCALLLIGNLVKLVEGAKTKMKKKMKMQIKKNIRKKKKKKMRIEERRIDYN